MAPVRAVPVVRVALEHVAHARLVGFQHIGPREGGVSRCILAAIGLDHQVVVGHQVGQVGVGRFQRHGHIVAIDLHRLDDLHDAKSTRFGILVAVPLKRGQHVGGGQVLAVVESDPLADLEHPCLGIGAAFDGFGHAHFKFARGGHFDQRFRGGVQVEIGHLRCGQCGIHAVGGFAALKADFQDAALDGTRRLHGLGVECAGHGRADTQCAHAAHELAPRHAAKARAQLEIINLVLVDLSGHFHLPVGIRSLGAILFDLAFPRQPCACPGPLFRAGPSGDAPCPSRVVDSRVNFAHRASVFN